MRKRLIRSTLVVVFAVVVAFGVPLGWLSANYLENRQQEEIERLAEDIASSGQSLARAQLTTRLSPATCSARPTE